MKKLKNSTILMIAGAVFVLIGAVLYITQNKNQGYVKNSSDVISQDEAVALANETTLKIIDIYEDPTSVFKVEETKKEEPKIEEKTEENEEKNKEEPKEETEDPEKKTEPTEEPNEYEDYYVVLNYDEVVKAMFTENGIKELEETTFDGKNFIIKDEGKVYLLKEIPEDNRYKGNTITIGTTQVLKGSIASEITITTYKLEDDMLTYYAIVKNLSLVKKDDKWLVDGFYYNNK